MLPALAAFPLLAGAAGAADIYLSLQAAGAGTYTVEGRFWTPTDPAGAWAILSDYDHLPFFVPSLDKSKVQQRSSSFLLLKQEATGSALGIFHRRLHVLLTVREKKDEEIDFEDTAHLDFDSYAGSWHIEPAAGGGSWVNYSLAAKPNFFAPAFVARRAFRTNAKDLLLSVQSEMIRRGRLSETLLCCSQR